MCLGSLGVLGCLGFWGSGIRAKGSIRLSCDARACKGLYGVVSCKGFCKALQRGSTLDLGCRRISRGWMQLFAGGVRGDFHLTAPC